MLLPVYAPILTNRGGSTSVDSNPSPETFLIGNALVFLGREAFGVLPLPGPHVPHHLLLIVVVVVVVVVVGCRSCSWLLWPVRTEKAHRVSRQVGGEGRRREYRCLFQAFSGNSLFARTTSTSTTGFAARQSQRRWTLRRNPVVPPSVSQAFAATVADLRPAHHIPRRGI